MTSDIVDEGFGLLDRFLQDIASIRIGFYRNESDDFSISTDMLSEVEHPVNNSDVLSMIPTGSNWAPAMGWRSFFAHSIRTASREWFAVGMEGVVAHQTRGANPILKAYLFPIDRKPLEPMKDLANAISEDKLRGRGTYGVIAASSQTPDDHRRVEATIISIAADSFPSKPNMLFRTLIICQERLQRVRAFHPLLIATVPSIRKEFTWKGNLWLKMIRKMN